jgi:hypothetical protein
VECRFSRLLVLYALTVYGRESQSPDITLGSNRCTPGEDNLSRRGDGSTFDRGKYMVVWKRVGDEWQIHRDMFSTSVPKAAAFNAASMTDA